MFWGVFSAQRSLAGPTLITRAAKASTKAAWDAERRRMSSSSCLRDRVGLGEPGQVEGGRHEELRLGAGADPRVTVEQAAQGASSRCGERRRGRCAGAVTGAGPSASGAGASRSTRLRTRSSQRAASHAQAPLSSQMVMGPSLTSSTSISAPNSPRPTGTLARLDRPGEDLHEARRQVRRGGVDERRSAALASVAVERELADHEHGPADVHQRAVGAPSSSRKMRRSTDLSAMPRASSRRVLRTDAHEGQEAGADGPASSPATVTRTSRTRCSRTRTLSRRSRRARRRPPGPGTSGAWRPLPVPGRPGQRQGPPSRRRRPRAHGVRPRAPAPPPRTHPVHAGRGRSPRCRRRCRGGPRPRPSCG